VSAFSPICHPSVCPWGQKAFAGYLGPEGPAWAEYDATELVSKYEGPPLSILIDCGKADGFYEKKQLLPEDFVVACAKAGEPVALRMQDGYDHSYYFISTFVEEHIDHHAEFLCK
jgi:S-formylglutathione hydrolase